jgi:hypothetical protein
MTEIQKARLATLVTLVERKPRLGRTALMKLCYFLQTLRNVPLGYRFTLFSYGPFDSNVLSDLASAETFGALSSDVVLRSSGYSYQIDLSPKSESLKGWAADFIKHYDADFTWVINEFGKWESADLELLSTIVYVDRESQGASEMLSSNALVQKVHDVKPRFEEIYIRERVKDLASLEVLQHVGVASAKSSAA